MTETSVQIKASVKNSLIRGFATSGTENFPINRYAEDMKYDYSTMPLLFYTRTE
jgi:hypothetical protein